jgi:branched-chain amino acid transport system substrate-binding protein
MKKSLFALLVTTLAFVAVVATGTSGASTKSEASAATALVKCGKTRTIGFMAPVTGPAADIGGEQVAWAKYFVARYNKTHKSKFKLQTEDTQLGAPTGTAEALKGAQALASNSSVLALAGPAGSNEIVGVTKSLKDAGLAWVSGSSTRTSLTTDGTRTGYMFRTVPPDAIQGTTAANFIIKTLKYKRVYIIDDQ